jgi:PBP1b-binding outer membrane lipoprotein LpoB
MMKLSRLFVLLVVVMFMFVGCAKEPTQEISDAKAALEAAVQEGAKTYMPTEI